MIYAFTLNSGFKLQCTVSSDARFFSFARSLIYLPFLLQFAIYSFPFYDRSIDGFFSCEKENRRIVIRDAILI